MFDNVPFEEQCNPNEVLLFLVVSEWIQNCTQDCLSSPVLLFSYRYYCTHKRDGQFHEVPLWKMYWICAREGVGESARLFTGSGRALCGCLATPRVWRSCRCGPGEWGAGGRVLCRKRNEGNVEHRQGKTRWMTMRMRRLFTCDAPSSWATECAVMCSWSKVCCAHAQVSVSVYRISV